MEKPVAVITGGSSGLGQAMAEILGQQGYRIVIIARDEKKMEDVVVLRRN